eukprot:5321428-Prymnesium_polylepis.1
MAEVIIMIVDLISGKAGEDVEGYGGSSWQVRFNNILLAVGKFVDLATDWILVVQLHAGAFGARPILTVVTVICASVGSAVELYAITVLARLKSNENVEPLVQGLRQTLLNQKLAWWRFGSDDLPTFAIGLFLLLGPTPVVIPPPPPPPAAPAPAACASVCGSKTCADVAEVSCDLLATVFGCDCNGCCALNATDTGSDCGYSYDGAAE